MIYAKFHTTGNITLKGYFDPTTNQGNFLEIYTNADGRKIAGLVAIAHITCIEYLNEE